MPMNYNIVNIKRKVRKQAKKSGANFIVLNRLYKEHALYLARTVKTLGDRSKILDLAEYHVNHATCHEVAINEAFHVHMQTHNHPHGREKIYTEYAKKVTRNDRVRLIWFYVIDILKYDWDSLEPYDDITGGFKELHCPLCGQIWQEMDKDGDLVYEEFGCSCVVAISSYGGPAILVDDFELEDLAEALRLLNSKIEVHEFPSVEVINDLEGNPVFYADMTGLRIDLEDAVFGELESYDEDMLVSHFDAYALEVFAEVLYGEKLAEVRQALTRVYDGC